MSERGESEPGKMVRAYVVRCAICGRTDVYPGHNKGRDHGAGAEARDMGWMRTSQLGEKGERLWVCAKHHEPNSYSLYVDKENDRREPWEVYDDLP
jgi:hypothetical protein